MKTVIAGVTGQGGAPENPGVLVTEDGRIKIEQGSQVQGTAGGLPVDISAASVTPTNRSGTITAGGTAQVLMPSNPARMGFWLQNHSVGDLWINDLGPAAASQPSERIPAGALYETPITGCPVGAISIFGATTAQAFSAREW